MVDQDLIANNQTSIQSLKTLPVLEKFSDSELETFLRSSEINTYMDNELIIQENTTDDRIFFLISGKAKVMKNGKELMILRRTGDIFGEIGVISGVARTASIYASGKATCLQIRLSDIDNLDEGNRLMMKYIIFRGFAEILANRLKTTTDELVAARNEVARIKSP